MTLVLGSWFLVLGLNLEVAGIDTNIYDAATDDHVQAELLTASNQGRAFGARIQPYFSHGPLSDFLNHLQANLGRQVQTNSIYLLDRNLSDRVKNRKPLDRLSGGMNRKDLVISPQVRSDRFITEFVGVGAGA